MDETETPSLYACAVELAARVAELEGALKECSHFVISPLRLSNDEEEAERRKAIYERAARALTGGSNGR
ncbi:hypothetical protein AB4099_34025 [Bosea sp. 2KB_26]|uniref:hypothetical protein n=1 Tax=Bosea sp. 2KB_26 TaxID=3237475 RepID=UPI003F9367DB